MASSRTFRVLKAARDKTKRQPDPSRLVDDRRPADGTRYCELPGCHRQLKAPAWQNNKRVRPHAKYCTDFHRMEAYRLRQQAKLAAAEAAPPRLVGGSGRGDGS